MRKIFYFLSLSVLLVACNENAPDAATDLNDNNIVQLKGEVMKIHDATMSKKGDLQSLLSSLKTAKYTNTTDSIAVQQAYKALKGADQSMMDWMRQFKQVDEQGWSDAEKTSYLESELKKMTVIENATLEALSLGNSTVVNINSAK